MFGKKNTKQHQDFVTNSNPEKVIIYREELEYISRCILDYPNIETGGNLFGHYTSNGIPVIDYVIGPGKKAVHKATEFQQEKTYLSDIYNSVFETFALSEIGAWHSHHQLDLPHPSGGDVRTVLNGLIKAELNEFIIVIGSLTPPLTPVNAFVFRNNPMKPYQAAQWIVLDSANPFRKIIDKTNENILSHPKNLNGNYAKTNKQYYVFEKQHWLSDKNNIKELMNIVNFIKQQTSRVKIFHPENDNIVIDIHLSNKNIKIIFPSTFPSESSYLISIKNEEGKLIDEICSVNITDGISQSIIKNIKEKKIL